jgi:mannose-6-phosphate isomerase-like protein (cupin superfamily)/SAM-dependent methyltransferase
VKRFSLTGAPPNVQNDSRVVYQVAHLYNPESASSFYPDALAQVNRMPYLYSLPTSTSFKGTGLSGYTFGPLDDREVEIYYIKVNQGHDTFQISRKITRIYYVLSGNGCFTIDNQKYNVGAGILVEIPPKVEYTYSGKMTLIAFTKPRWFRGNDIPTKWNPDVAPRNGSFVRGNGCAWSERLLTFRVFGKSPLNAYLRLNQVLWSTLPSSIIALAPFRSYGRLLHRLARIRGGRAQALGTYFLRNRPELELIRRLIRQKAKGDTLRVAVLGCSAGAEAYSVAWRIRSARPDLTLILQAMDISREAVEFAKCGVYPLTASELTGTAMLERMTTNEMEELFQREADVATVRSWLKEGINWHVGDVGEPEIFDALGPQDMVVANNFLCHMDPPDAERCLRNIARLVSPHGYLFVSGIDLDIRTKVARDLHWKPLEEFLEEIHEGDPCLRSFWPFHYTGLEPLNKRRRDWRIRYAAGFQLPPSHNS